MRELYVWKFMIEPGQENAREIGPGLTVEGIQAVALASTESLAREVLKKFAREYGRDTRWLEVARVIRLDVADESFISWAE